MSFEPLAINKHGNTQLTGEIKNETQKNMGTGKRDRSRGKKTQRKRTTQGGK